MLGDTDSGRPRPGPVIGRIASAIGIAAEGAMISLGLLVAGTILILLGLKVIGAIVVLIAVPITLFFRDPDRFPAKTENVVISGADGKITDIAEVSFPGAAGALYHRVSALLRRFDLQL